jgi:LysR family glycine cleavage system transcriptional activator
LRAFEAAARHLSFVRAAEELHVTPAAISQQIKLLEDHLGTQLFIRGKKLTLSDPANEVLPLISESFDQLERTMTKLRPKKTGDTLVISAPPAFAARWLIPRLDDFQTLHPNIDIRLLATKRLVNFQVEDVDIGIRFGKVEFGDLVGDRLMPEAIIAVANPRLAETIMSPEDLTRCNLLEDEWHTENGVFPDWGVWISSLGANITTPLRIKKFGDANLAIQAASSGLGVTLTWYSLVVDDLKAGRLVRLLDQVIQTDHGYYLVMPKNRSSLSKVNSFFNWIMRQSAIQKLDEVIR